MYLQLLCLKYCCLLRWLGYCPIMSRKEYRNHGRRSTFFGAVTRLCLWGLGTGVLPKSQEKHFRSFVVNTKSRVGLWRGCFLLNSWERGAYSVRLYPLAPTPWFGYVPAHTIWWWGCSTHPISFGEVQCTPVPPLSDASDRNYDENLVKLVFSNKAGHDFVFIIIHLE